MKELRKNSLKSVMIDEFRWIVVDKNEKMIERNTHFKVGF